eukprot:9022871-Pyramimonas_sp.AAC.1
MRGRNCCVIILEVDALSRAHSARPEADDNCPVLYALDYGHAFPSLSQEFAMLALVKMGCPSALIRLIAILYDAIQGVIAIQGFLRHAFWIRSGIIQGDALSGPPFAVALSPAL